MGQYLVVNHPQYGLTPLTIVEVEAYTNNDPACHANGYTAKTAPKRALNLFGAPGTGYVYLIYGMYHCLNVITEPKGTAGAVLFRGVVDTNSDGPFVGTNLIGPGRLCRDVGITTAQHNGVMLTKQDAGLYLATSVQGPTEEEHINTTPRIGIQHAKDYPWRWIDTRYLKK